MGRRFRVGVASLTASAALAGGLLTSSPESAPAGSHVEAVTSHQVMPPRSTTLAKAAMTTCVLPDLAGPQDRYTFWRPESFVGNPQSLAKSYNPIITDPTEVSTLGRQSLVASKIPFKASMLSVNTAMRTPVELAESAYAKTAQCTAAHAGMIALEKSIENFAVSYPNMTTTSKSYATEQAKYDDGPVECYFDTILGVDGNRPNTSKLYMAALTIQASTGSGEKVLADFSVYDEPGQPLHATIFVAGQRSSTDIDSTDDTLLAANNLNTANAYTNQILNELFSVN